MERSSEENGRLLDLLAAQQRALLSIAQVQADQIGLGELAACVVREVERVYSPGIVRLVMREMDGSLHVVGAEPQPIATLEALDSWLLGQAEVGEPFEVSLHNHEFDSEICAALSNRLSFVKAAPIAERRVVTGILWIGFNDARRWGDRDWDFLRILAYQVAAASAQQSKEAWSIWVSWLPEVMDRIPEPVIVMDRDLVVRLSNPAAGILARGDSGGLVGCTLREIAGLSSLADPLLTGEAASEGWQAPEVVAQDGIVFVPHISVLPGGEGGIRGWVLVLRDISHSKRIAASVSDFLGTVSHDMRSPLTFMRGYIDMLGMVGDLNERQIGFIEKISEGVTQMADMVEKVLEAGKLDPSTGNYQLVREPVDVAEMVWQIAGEFADHAARKRLDLSCSVDVDAPIVVVDRAMLHSAFTNLIENAVKYTPDGGRIEIELRCDDAQIVFCVTDNGYGIRTEDQAKLFERHVRLHRKEWKRVKGSGLGLFIVKNVARRHGGDAWVESEEGRGSSFYLAIPLAGANLVGAADRRIT